LRQRPEAAPASEISIRGFDFFCACHYHNTEDKMMKRKINRWKKWIILNALFLVLSIVITINLLETGGKPTLPQETPAATQTAS